MTFKVFNKGFQIVQTTEVSMRHLVVLGGSGERVELYASAVEMVGPGEWDFVHVDSDKFRVELTTAVRVESEFLCVDASSLNVISRLPSEWLATREQHCFVSGRAAKGWQGATIYLALSKISLLIVSAQDALELFSPEVLSFMNQVNDTGRGSRVIIGIAALGSLLPAMAADPTLCDRFFATCRSLEIRLRADQMTLEEIDELSSMFQLAGSRAQMRMRIAIKNIGNSPYTQPLVGDASIFMGHPFHA